MTSFVSVRLEEVKITIVTQIIQQFPLKLAQPIAASYPGTPLVGVEGSYVTLAQRSSFLQ